ncbi:hypothetical protein KKB10_02910 [Patescibacteria group bacterium]|nr:hypothetical protein [Patescibacteria group bacterium]MBU1075268.1 hypothetical protein [Patescibacteria group bacterium]MBU1952168.1 hypothetical protein [Patescibacteria group bacterium]MBU2236218.1 hypothetical protein [Patescibacteria group bacterium]
MPPKKQQPQNSKIINLLFLIAVIVVGAIGAYYLITDSDSDTEINTKKSGSTKTTITNQPASSSNENINKNTFEGDELNVGNGFTITVPTGWNLAGFLEDAINIVKFGSPAQIYTLTPEGGQIDMFGPVISVDTFTIDENLNATEVVNLIHDQGIASDLERKKDNCFFEMEKSKFGQFDTFSFIRDNTDPEKCNEEATETAKSQTVVLKEKGNSDTAILTLVAIDDPQLVALLPDFQQILGSMKYKKTVSDTVEEAVEETE